MSQSQATTRQHFTTQRLTPDQRSQLEDVKWARHDPQVLAGFAGEFVVPYKRQIVAHGTNPADVLAEAARVTGRPSDSLALCGIDDPLQELSD